MDLVNNTNKVFFDSYYSEDNFNLTVATRCIHGIKTFFDKSDYERAVQFYSELFDLFYTDESTDKNRVEKLKEMQFSFTSLLSDEVIYGLTDYLKGSGAKRVNSYLDYSIKFKNEIPKDILVKLKISYMNYIIQYPTPLLTFFDYLKIEDNLMSYDESIMSYKEYCEKYIEKHN